MKKVLQSVLMIAAFALMSPVVSSAQTTAVAPADGSTTTTATKAAPASTDSTAVTSVGFNAGVTSLAGDSNGNVYASLQYTNKVVKLNGGGTVIGTFAVGGNPTGLLVDNANSVLYVLNNADNTVSKLGLDGTFIATYPVAGEGPVYAALYGSTLYIACERSSTLVRMTTGGTALGSTNVAARPVWVLVTVTSMKGATTDATATPADTTTTATDTTAMKTGTSSVNVYVSCNKANQVWKLSSVGEVLAKYDSGRGPFGLAVNSNGNILVACFWDAVVLRLSGIDGTVLGKTAVGDGAAGLIAYGNVVAVIENGTNSITRLSAVDGSVISKDKVDRAPLAGAATASALWVGCTGSGTVARRAL
jgi:streptogramin lyase